MSKKLSDRHWKIGYGSDEDNLITDFYIPALECAMQYDRKAGFFNSSILSRVARGIGALLENQGRMRLIMGCQFSPEDLQAVQQGYALRDALTSRLDTELTPPSNFAQLKHFEILSWLIQNEYLDIRIAIPLKPSGQPDSSERVLDPQHLFHEKVGIISDANGDCLAFNGSNNESIGGWQSNRESFHVFFSWDGGRDLQRVQHESDRFERLWKDELPNVRVFEIPTAVKQKLLRYAPTQKPDWNQQAEFDDRPIAPKREILNLPTEEPTPPPQVEIHISKEELQAESEQFIQLANIHDNAGCLDFSVKSIPVKPWAHQMKILRRMAAEFPRNALIADEVGLGKTIETGLVLRYLLLSKKVKRVLILAPASVQPQWQEEMREKFNLHFWSYGKNELVDPYKQSVTITGNPWNQKNLVLASSHLVRRKERMQELLESEPWDLVVLDEAHHARRKSPQNRKDTPNRLLELMDRLRSITQALLLLSATPMQIDAIEMFDLLKLIGLEGLWRSPDAFCDYFATLAEPADPHNLNFWQTMSVDYFATGGQPCPKVRRSLESSDRLLACQIEDVWQSGQKITSPQKYLANDHFIKASKQFLGANTPIKDLMFRHTRDTLREYYKRGFLDKDVPVREVFDNAIVLEPNREVLLYQAVSDYVRHFYRLAQKENRKALGFLMTLYRKRLTSSFYAIEKSLQRRLECLLTQQGNLLADDDYGDLDDADDAIIEGLESFMEPVDPKEIEYLQELLTQFANTGEDTKRSEFIKKLRQESLERDSAIVFTQYTDTMDYLRDTLLQLYGSQVACYSGRGGELYQENAWQIVPKEEIKRRFRDGEIKLLLCTESASEGLNLQTCGVLFNYDMPWNPMRVEQRIGRIDRIGQKFSQVRIHNFYYDGTVEAKVYLKLRDRIKAFTTVVGNLQPILARVPTFIERAVMSADPLEEDVLLSEFDQTLDISPLQPKINEAVAMDVDADLAELRKPIPPSPFDAEAIEQMFTRSLLLQKSGITFEDVGDKVWTMQLQQKSYQVTFHPDTFDEHPSLRLMTFGDPLFEYLLAISLTIL
ncbi:MAG: DEAD/DEAH box helicase family protein [Pseudanabaena sp. M57BS1SP1A06MG]|nr:DEAD/DEAH box helicase family protein [Pseudanabaena sp. M53BS1SP1A06MG]MCA6584711.1 DEAD/DEAH box helicase family protein [Pseudanabaena sp. M34BS1SP1A06MG]MCA6594546.1 DEAD/DEAH box helicase family protein [Pseudanabaena sp. M38BS1SP1A06MG]MCA6601466.1 DEAD/DEAH box helicase family protein [Pseudanabaena sp. M57BS1SP1A06MG]